MGWNVYHEDDEINHRIWLEIERKREVRESLPKLASRIADVVLRKVAIGGISYEDVVNEIVDILIELLDVGEE